MSLSSLVSSLCSIPRINKRICSIWARVCWRSRTGVWALASQGARLFGVGNCPAGEMILKGDDEIVLLLPCPSRVVMGTGAMSRDDCRVLAWSNPARTKPTYLPVFACQFGECLLEHLFSLLCSVERFLCLEFGWVRSIQTHLSSSAIHLSFSLCVPCNNRSRFLYSFSSSWIRSAGGRWASCAWRIWICVCN